MKHAFHMRGFSFRQLGSPGFNQKISLGIIKRFFKPLVFFFKLFNIRKSFGHFFTSFKNWAGNRFLHQSGINTKLSAKAFKNNAGRIIKGSLFDNRIIYNIANFRFNESFDIFGKGSFELFSICSKSFSIFGFNWFKQSLILCIFLLKKINQLYLMVFINLLDEF